MQSDRRKRLGRWGEQAAADYLTKRGYEISDRNVRTPYGEIDLLVRQDKLVIFVEVKARASRSFGPPEVSVTPRKQSHMIACAEYFAQQNGIEHWRIDVVSVQRTPEGPQIYHFENAVS